MGSTIKQRLRRFNGTDYDTIYLSPNVGDAIGTLPVANGGTGATTASDALHNLGLTHAAGSDTVDIDTLVDPGYYKFNIWSNVTGNTTGLPYCEWSDMHVTRGHSSDSATQVLYRYTGNVDTFNLYGRSGNIDSSRADWIGNKSWKQIATTDMIPATMPASQVLIQDSSLGSTVDDGFSSLKTSVSEGKAAIASAITDKGVSTASDASFSTMATNIRAIQTSSIALSSIAVTTAPSKTTYTALETFNSAGMVVTATYSNGATKNVTSGCTWPTTALNAGTTSITITYSEDGVTKTTTQAITVNKISVTVPSQSGTLTYTGGSRRPSWNNKPSTSIATYGGTTSGTNAGSYTATFTLVNTSNYKWADTTAAARNVTWSISQAANSMALSKTTMTLNASKTSDTLTISGNYDGTVSVSSSDTSVATVSRSGSTVTVNSVNSTTGSATITVSATGSNYTAASKTCAVTATFFVNPLNTDQLTLGMTTVYFTAYPNIKWCVDHIDGNYVYLGGYNINEATTFGSSTTYSGSTIASKCTTYLNNTIPNVADYLENVTVHGVTAKVFIPSKKMFSGTASSGGVDANDPTFDYPSASAANRKACYAALSSNAMWLSSPRDSSAVWYVYDDGNFYKDSYGYPEYSHGFRPEVKVQYKA